MKFILDTDALSELRKGRFGNPGFRQWSDSVPVEDVAVSVITLQELETGILLAARKDRARSLVFRAWFDHVVLPRFEDRIIPVDDRVAFACAPLHVPNKRPYPDSLIAATALVNDLTVVTRNTKDFAPMGVRLLNPWDA